MPKALAHTEGNSLTAMIDINSELDELDREEFYRLKKVAAKKQRDNAETDAQMKAKKAEQQRLLTLAEGENVEGEQATEAPVAPEATDLPDDTPADILAAEEDEDIIF